jgi:hypothetical protein
MGLSGQRHAPAALYPRRKDPRYLLYRRLGGPQNRSGHRGLRKNPLPLPEIEPRSPGRPARKDSILPELTRLLKEEVTLPNYIYFRLSWLMLFKEIIAVYSEN